MATRYDRRLEKLEDQQSGPLVKVHACPTPGMHEGTVTNETVVAEIARCPSKDCTCRTAFDEHMKVTRGRGHLIILDYDAARL
jgi:hypothetical protein